MDSKDRDAFHKLRPNCITFSYHAFRPADSYDPESDELLKVLQKIREQLNQLIDEHQELSPKIADYIFIPINALLKHNSLGIPQTQELLLIFSNLITLCWSRAGTFPLPLSQKLLQIVTFLISSETNHMKLLCTSLEFKDTTIRVLKSLFISFANHKNGNIYNMFQEKDNLVMLGPLILILLDILTDSTQEYQIQILTLETLNILYTDTVNNGEILSHILPGNISTFSKLLMLPGNVVNYRVVCDTLKLLGDLLKLVFNDQELKAEIKGLQLLSNDELDLDVNSRVHIQSSQLHRDDKWLKGTSYQVKLTLDGLLPKIMKRNNQLIKKSLNEFVLKVLEHCNICLSNCSNQLIEVALSTQEDISTITQINLFSVEKLVNDELTKLPHTIQFEQLEKIKLLKNSVIMIGTHKQLDHFLIMNLLKCLIDSLTEYMNSKTIRFCDTKIQEQSSQIIISHSFKIKESTITHLIPKLDKDMEKSIADLLQTIGHLYEPHLLNKLVEWLLSNDDSNTYSFISLWVSTNLVKGYSFKNYDDNFTTKYESTNIIYTLLEHTYSLILSTGIDPELTKSSEMNLVLCLNGIRHCINIIGKEFQSDLIEYLYPIVELLTSPSDIVRSMAQNCIIDISNLLYDGSIHDLIMDNIDYLVDSISIRLNDCIVGKSVLIMSVICKVAGYEVMNSFRDIIEKFFCLLDYYHGYERMCLDIFDIFEVIIEEMRKRYLTNNDESTILANTNPPRCSFQPWGMESIDQVIESLDNIEFDDILDDTDSNGALSAEEYFHKKIEIDSDDEEDNTGEILHSSEDTHQQNITWNSPIPKESFKLLLQMISYGDRLLTHSSRNLKLYILRLFKKLIPMISTDYNSLLPHVSKIWDLIVNLSMGSDYSIVNESCQVLEIIIKYSGDFITKRFLDLWNAYEKHSYVINQLRTIGNGNLLYCNELKHAKSIYETVNLFDGHHPLQETYIIIAHMLKEGIRVSEFLIPDETLARMIQFIPDLVDLPSFHSMNIRFFLKAEIV